MVIGEDKTFKVLNYCTSPISLQGQNRQYMIEGCADGIAGFEMISFRDIEYINSRSSVIRTGAIEFEEECRESLYDALHFPDWKEKALFERDIDGLVLNVTADNISRIIAIKDIFTLERVRGHMVGLKSDPTQDVSVRMEKIIKERRDELCMGKVNSKMKVVPADSAPAANGSEMDALRKQIADMQKMLSAVLGKGSEDNTEAKPEPAEAVKEEKTEDSKEPVPKTKRGRSKTAEAK